MLYTCVTWCTFVTCSDECGEGRRREERHRCDLGEPAVSDMVSLEDDVLQCV